MDTPPQTSWPSHGLPLRWLFQTGAHLSPSGPDGLHVTIFRFLVGLRFAVSPLVSFFLLEFLMFSPPMSG